MLLRVLRVREMRQALELKVETYIRSLLSQQPRLSADNLTSVCTSACLTSLNSAKATIKGACTQATDLIPLYTGSYPATFLVDLFIYTYGINCRRDSCVPTFPSTLSPQEKCSI